MGKGRDGLYRRENAVLAFRYKDENEKWRERYTGTTDRKKARDIRDQFLRELKDGTLPTEMGKWRLDQAEKWWNEYRKPRISGDTAKSERYRLQHFGRILGNKQLEKMRNHDLDVYQNKRLDERVGAHSINKEILLLSQILKKAKLWRRLRDDYKPLPTQPSDIGRALSRGELGALAQVAQTDVAWEAAFYGSVLAANCGLRGGEIKKLRIKVIDLDRRRLLILRKTTKTNAGARHIELNLDAREAAWRLWLRARRLGAKDPDHYLMPKHLSRIMYGPDKGKRGYDPTQHQEYWDTAWHSLTSAVRCPGCGELQSPAECCRVETCKANMQGLRSATEGLRFHDLRHGFITDMVERGSGPSKRLLAT
jgi:integrase